MARIEARGKIGIAELQMQADGSRATFQRDLAELLHISPAAVANSLKSLEKGGYIRRKPSQGDARRNLVTLTEKGAAAVKECDRVFERVSTRMLEGFSEEEQGQLVAFRRRMLDNLTKQNHSSCEQEG